MTDVLERDYVRALPEQPSPAPPPATPKKKWRAGVQMMGGTLGAIVTKNDKDDEKLLLTSYHVLEGVNEAQNIEIDHERHTIRSKNPKVSPQARTDVEAVVIELSDPMNRYEYTSEVKGIGPLTGTSLPYLYMQVRKNGKATGLTYGVVSEFEKTVRIGQTELANQVEIATDLVRNTQFCKPGDSGSIVVDNAQKAVGLLSALDQKSKQYAIANPIREVLNQLDVALYLDEQDGLDKAIDDVMRDITSPAVDQTVYLQANYLGPGPKRLLSLGWIDDGCCRSGGC